MPAVEKYTYDIFADDENNDFYVSFFSEAFVNAIKKWLLERDAIPAEKFISLMKSCIQGAAQKVLNDIIESEDKFKINAHKIFFSVFI